MKKHLLFLSLLIMFTCGVDAQLNLNRLGKKVKEQVENKKEEVRTETEVERVAGPSNMTQEGDEGGEYSYKKKYKPSAKALAADPKTADQTVEAMYTKSISEIHAAYEQFDSELFPYKPYYNYRQFYYLHDEKEEEARSEQYTSIVMNIAKLPAGAFYYMPYTPIQSPDGEVLVTYDEFFRNAWTALFIADPLSPWAFHKYVNVLMFENRMFEIKYTYKMSDAEKGIVNAETGALLFAPSEAAYTHVQDSRKLLALSLARNEVTIDYLSYYLNELFKQCNAETNPVLKYILYWKIDAIMVNVFRQHKEYDASDVATRKVEASYSALESQRFDIETDARMHSAETVEMPKSVQVDGTTSSKVNAMAQTQFRDEFVKTVFLGNNWTEFKEDKYPYRVMHLSLPVAVVVKRGGKYLINYYDVTRSPSGGDWHMMVQMGSSFMPVKSE